MRQVQNRVLERSRTKQKIWRSACDEESHKERLVYAAINPPCPELFWPRHESHE